MLGLRPRGRSFAVFVARAARRSGADDCPIGHRVPSCAERWRSRTLRWRRKRFHGGVVAGGTDLSHGADHAVMHKRALQFPGTRFDCPVRVQDAPGDITVDPVVIDVPRDRDSTFEPVIVPRRQRRLDSVDNMVLSLTAKGLTSGRSAPTSPRSTARACRRRRSAGSPTRLSTPWSAGRTGPRSRVTGGVHRRDPRQDPRRPSRQPPHLRRHWCHRRRRTRRPRTLGRDRRRRSQVLAPGFDRDQ